MQVKERGAKTKYLSWVGKGREGKGSWEGKAGGKGEGLRCGLCISIHTCHAMPYIIFSFFSFWAEGKARGDPAVGLFV